MFAVRHDISRKYPATFLSIFALPSNFALNLFYRDKITSERAVVQMNETGCRI